MYTDWAKAQEQIKGFPRPRYKKFATREEAEQFVREAETGQAPDAPGMLKDVPRDEQGAPVEPGDGPLPPGAEDGFDPNLLLDPATGKVVYRSAEQANTTKLKATGPPGMLRIYTDGSSLKNGQELASAGVGVYFGPGDTRFVFIPANLLSFSLLQSSLTSTFFPQQKRLGAPERWPTDQSTRGADRHLSRAGHRAPPPGRDHLYGQPVCD